MHSWLGLGIGYESSSKAPHLEKADAQNTVTRGSYRPTADSGWNNFYGRERHKGVIHVNNGN
jgi:hypothetical protein